METISRIGLLALIAVFQALGQFGVFQNLGHTPQAKTPEEFDAYLEILSETDASRRAHMVSAFAQRFAGSELLGNAYQHQLTAFVELDSLAGVLTAGRIVLARIPDNLTALLTLASSIPNGTTGRTDAVDLLDAAELYANTALEVLEKKQIPRSIPFVEWKLARSEMQAQAHESLGHVAAKRGNFAEAVLEFERARDLSPRPAGRQFFRLGVAYTWVGRLTEARHALESAVSLGPDPIRRLAQDELKKINAPR